MGQSAYRKRMKKDASDQSAWTAVINFLND
jgi:hypothetical protein